MDEMLPCKGSCVTPNPQVTHMGGKRSPVPWKLALEHPETTRDMEGTLVHLALWSKRMWRFL